MQQQRIDAMQADQHELAVITAELRIREAFSSCVPKNADLVIEAGDLALVFRKQTNDTLDSIPSSALMECTCTSLTTIAKSSSISIKYFLPPHTTTSYLKSTLYLHCIRRSRNYPPIVYANLLPLTAKISYASSSQRFNTIMILECEVCKLIEHESKK